MKDQTIMRFLTVKPKPKPNLPELTNSPVGNDLNVGKIGKRYGGEMIIVGENEKPEPKGTEPDGISNEKTVNGKGRLLTKVLTQQQPGVVQKTGRDTEVFGGSYEKTCTDGLERSIPESVQNSSR